MTFIKLFRRAVVVAAVGVTVGLGTLFVTAEPAVASARDCLSGNGYPVRHGTIIGRAQCWDGEWIPLRIA